MEIAKAELNVVETILTLAHEEAVKELGELQLSLVAGGSTDVTFA